ncbi:NAD(P)H-dependent oxidoreductase [Porticoccus sp. W117]|uniref:NADPH-dependent FMN reductase n=1 Tax=Porticoccus sp. W117 TaxID=3054777 RepID=UPI0025929B0D|nr:NAD(P)H-dependent oxidoreductase [Porticoccus sp. W117]MDM3872165.1 NAD(P)H-dependent oxidoreductase [Porticoccus sp. W117]
MKVLAFSSSNSKHSINRVLATYAANLIEGATVEVLDIHDYELPLFSPEREAELGHPQLARDFLDKIAEADALVISHAEHNGSYTAAFKNLFDWASRGDRKVFQDKPTLLLATSPGPGGAKNVLAHAETSAPHFRAEVVAAISVPKFQDNFDVANNTLTNSDIHAQLLAAIEMLRKASKRSVS